MTNNIAVLRMQTETLGEHLRKLAMRADIGELRSGVFAFVTDKGHAETSWWIKPHSDDVLTALAATDIVHTEFKTLIMKENTYGKPV